MASQELNQALWGAANVMRSTMSADEYKDYLLGLVFYKYLSDRQLYAVVDLLEDRKPDSLDEAHNRFMRKPVMAVTGMIWQLSWRKAMVLPSSLNTPLRLCIMP